MACVGKKKLLVSFSGGLTSAYMLKVILDNWNDEYEMIIIFANTGKEHEGTLKFVEDCAKNFNTEIIWIESVPKTKKGWGVTYRLVNYETASRNGKPFEDMIRLTGIPSTAAPFCSVQLKRNSIKAYLREIGWKKYYTAIGIRADEIDRMNPNRKKERIIYPLINAFRMNKKMINDFWKEQSFTLNVPKGFGNCNNCWKKDLKTLANNMRNEPASFDWWQEMIDKYGHLAPRKSAMKMKPPFSFFRGQLMPKDILTISKLEDTQLKLFAEDNRLNGCGDSCEAF